MVKKYYSATFHSKPIGLPFGCGPFAKTAVLVLKIHVFASFLHEESKQMLNILLLQCMFFNIRYMLIFQIEKIFCPDFLLFHANILTTV